VKALQEAIIGAPKYDASNRKPTKYSEELDHLLDDILASEVAKTAELGAGHKQKLTNVQIHELVRAAGHDVCLTMIKGRVKEKRGRAKEAFIRQEYGFGERLEYDFGEVRLNIGGNVVKRYIAVFCSPGGKFLHAYLYKTQNKEAFLDSHVRFFEMAGGVWEEVVYDNMRNVVSKFIGPSEKELNKDLVQMSLYYGFKPNVTNSFHGNEKGSVEGGVKVIRNKAFATAYKFDDDEGAELRLAAVLDELNSGSSFEEERAFLLPYKPPLDIAKVSMHTVDKYGFVRVDNNFYSVPEYLVGRTVMVKNYLAAFDVYSANQKVLTRKKESGKGGMYPVIFHYLDTLERKPGALRNSAALKADAELKAVFERCFAGRPREFITALRENRDKPMAELLSAVEAAASPASPASGEGIGANVAETARRQTRALARLFMAEEEGGGGCVH
jgi:hypothetical protein